MVAISVCMPVYNGAKFLPRAFKCLAEQTLRDFELVIVDDGSTDDSADLATALLAEHSIPGIVIRIANGGPEQARDVACQHAKGAVIANFDCDDWWESTYIAEMLRALQTSRSDLVYCDFIEQFPDGREIRKSDTATWVDLNRAKRIGDVYCFPQRAFFPILLSGQVLFPPCTVYTRELYGRAGSYAALHPSLRISLDWCFGLRASRLGSVAFLKRALLRKFVHGDNVSGNLERTVGCTIQVLRSVLDQDLTPEERRNGRARGAMISSWVSEKLWSDGRQIGAIAWALRSVGFRWSTRGAKALCRSLVPSVVNSLRNACQRQM